MVQRLHKELGLITLDDDKIRSVCNQLLKDNQARDRAIGDLTGMVERSLDRLVVQRPRPDAVTKHPIIQQDLNEGNLCAADIGITWEGSDTFLHGVRVVRPGAAELLGRHHPSTYCVRHVDSETATSVTGVLGSSGCSTPPCWPRRTPKLPTGGTHTALQ